MPLPKRDRDILTTIIEAYIASAAPVGSRTVAKLSPLGLSPASIRNIMADLTEAGYLEQPHTSSGRLPTARAFRFYLDEVMRLCPLPDAHKQRIATDLGSAGLEVGDILRQASRILSGLSLQVALVVAPRHADVRVNRIDFALIKPGLVMVILILQGGLVIKRVLETEPGITTDDLIAYGNYLNRQFADLTLTEVRLKLAGEMALAEKTLNALSRRALTLALAAFGRETAGEREMFVDGTVHILAQPEFADLEHMRELMHVLDQRSRLLELLDKMANAVKTVVTIGGEAELAALTDLGMITAPYGSVAHPLGTIGLLGPLRMDYAKLVPVVSYTASLLTRMLDRHF